MLDLPEKFVQYIIWKTSKIIHVAELTEELSADKVRQKFRSQNKSDTDRLT